VIIPAYNEDRSLSELTGRAVQVLSSAGFSGEVIIVNDGSTDKTKEVVDELVKKYNIVKAFHHRRNLGKSASLRTGFDKARGTIIVMLDADLQYAPEDIPKLIDMINKGYDVVNGWRKSRADSIGRKASSSFYNFLTRQIFGLTIQDFNSGLKAFRREVIEDIETTGLRSDFHRYLLPLAHQLGYRVGEIEIQHFPRSYGKTRYGARRLILGVLDLISLKLQFLFRERPMTLFGISGISLLFLGGIFGVYVVLLKLLYREPFEHHLALLLLSVLLIIAGLQSFFFGFLADILATFRLELLERMKTERRSET